MKETVAVLGLAAAFLLPFGGKAHREVELGNRAYEEGEYEEALRAYTEAGVAAPEAPELHYDIGNVLYRQGDFEGAAEAYTRAVLSAPPTLLPDASYNLGNALYRGERYEEAVKAFRRALEARPGDRDAKRNLELALRQLEARQQPQAGQDEEQKPRDETGQEEEGRDESGQEAPRDPEEQDEPRGGGEDDAGGKPESEVGEMSPEEARRLLDGLAEQERQNLDRQAPAAREQAREKDW